MEGGKHFKTYKYNIAISIYCAAKCWAKARANKNLKDMQDMKNPSSFINSLIESLPIFFFWKWPIALLTKHMGLVSV